MKALVFSLTLVMSLSSFAASWLVLTKSQQRQIKSDACARAALNSVTKMVQEDIDSGIIAQPKSVQVLELRKLVLKNKYRVTLQDDVPMTVEVKSLGNNCIAGKPVRLMDF